MRKARPSFPDAIHATATHLRRPPFETTLPAPLVFRSVSVLADTVYPRHLHDWGEFVYSFSGVMEIELAQQHYLAPPQYGMWLPPQTAHVAFNRHAASHCSLYIDKALCRHLPQVTCALTVSPFMRALLEELRRTPPGIPGTPQEQRLLQVLVDLLEQAECTGTYLPASNDPLLKPVLLALQANPGDSRTIAEFATLNHTTERTLMRRCQRDLGMSFVEWRQRLKVLTSLARLDKGETVETIGLDLGYSSASAFISMFRRLMGTTPDEYRKGNRPQVMGLPAAFRESSRSRQTRPDKTI
ncbi:AraC family transcriptional regulator [Advenella kashmirensis]|uniref:AraC family transcriptional regulator n=1 Tax=Advenella kashmirensis TaxID=310575 RepID=UPI0003F5980F|nr:helix-turn-helix transcriptional regulator [Advenella kashmirensis]